MKTPIENIIKGTIGWVDHETGEAERYGEPYKIIEYDGDEFFMKSLRDGHEEVISF